MIINDTLPYEVDSGLLSNVRDSIVQGFRWVAGKGRCVMSLCDK